MGFDSRAFFKGLKKSDLSKLSEPDGCDWRDYYDLDYWLLTNDCHEPLVISDGKALLTKEILEQLKDIITKGGFGANSEIDEEYKDDTLTFIADALLTIQLGGAVIYESDGIEEDEEDDLDSQRAYLGLWAEEMTDGIPGLRVAGVTRDSPASKSGFQENDRIIGIDGDSISKNNDMVQKLSTTQPGQTVKFLINRSGLTLELTTILISAAMAQQLFGRSDDETAEEDDLKD
jgi:hypothetical protein